MTIREFKELHNDNPAVNYYFELYTGYSEDKERDPDEIQQIEQDCFKTLAEPISFEGFADRFKWHYVQQNQLREISDEDCEKHWKALDWLSAQSTGSAKTTFEHWLEFWLEKREATIEIVEKEDLKRPDFLTTLIKEEKSVITMLLEHKVANSEAIAEKTLEKLTRLGF